MPPDTTIKRAIDAFNAEYAAWQQLPRGGDTEPFIMLRNNPTPVAAGEKQPPGTLTMRGGAFVRRMTFKAAAERDAFLMREAMTAALVAGETKERIAA